MDGDLAQEPAQPPEDVAEEGTLAQGVVLELGGQRCAGRQAQRTTQDGQSGQGGEEERQLLPVIGEGGVKTL